MGSYAVTGRSNGTHTTHGSVFSAAHLGTQCVIDNMLVCVLLVVVCQVVRAAETVNSTQIRIENNSAQKDYQLQEEGKVLPFRTFLTDVEIIVICVATVFIFLVLLIIYLCVYGCVLPDCCRCESKEYTQVQLQRERKISEIWKTNYK